MTKEEFTSHFIEDGKKAKGGTRIALANFLERLDGYSRNEELTYSYKVANLQAKVNILREDNCGNCPGLPTPQQQQTQVNLAREIITKWIEQAEISLTTNRRVVQSSRNAKKNN